MNLRLSVTKNLKRGERRSRIVLTIAGCEESYRIRRDPGLILYYTFDPKEPLYKSILNRSGASAGDSMPIPVTCRIDKSSHADAKRALACPAIATFRLESSPTLESCACNELNITQSVSLAAWIRPTLPLFEPRAVIVSNFCYAIGEEAELRDRFAKGYSGQRKRMHVVFAGW